ncbi:myosin-2 essential light chain-like [Tubulanus polymorphus]|uniref:myosin-2 essential light chain-like n=1 Tax=Tubulanus polymorphus TaxID=672921 RepID=UPI003DA615CC
MANMTEQDILEYSEVFSLFDNKGDGKIYGNQLGDVLRAIGENPTEADVRKHGLASETDKRISFEEFIPILATVCKNRDGSKITDFIEGFRVFDKEQNGLISSAELRHLLTHLGERLKDEEVEQLLSGMEDPQGNVNYEEFVNTVYNG